MSISRGSHRKHYCKVGTMPFSKACLGRVVLATLACHILRMSDVVHNFMNVFTFTLTIQELAQILKYTYFTNILIIESLCIFFNGVHILTLGWISIQCLYNVIYICFDVSSKVPNTLYLLPVLPTPWLPRMTTFALVSLVLKDMVGTFQIGTPFYSRHNKVVQWKLQNSGIHNEL